MVLLSRGSASKKNLSEHMGFSGRQDPYMRMWKTSPFYKLWQMETKGFSLKKFQPKAGNVACEIEPDALPKNMVYRRRRKRGPVRLF